MSADSRLKKDFPSFLEGLSLRHLANVITEIFTRDFPSFLEGLSLRRSSFARRRATTFGDFPSFLEGLSLRQRHAR